MPLRHSLLVLALLSLATAVHGQSTDRIRTARGSESGEITKMTPLAVTITSGGQSKEIPVPEIRSIIFRGEPSELTQARLNANNAGYENALATLDAINMNNVRGEYIEQEIEYYKAFCAAKLALVGSRPVAEAGSGLQSFVTKYPSNFHFLEASELLGDLLVHMGNYAAAQKKYELLAQSPFPSDRMRSRVLVGQTLLAQRNYPEALKQFESVLTIKDDTPAGKQQLLAANLGMGVATAATGKVDEGIQRIEGVIRDADPENARLLAQAYNALGASYREAGQAKEALYAYLHVDLLYGRIADAHAEALYHLAPLWEAVGQDGEARKARQTLEQKYPSSRWTTGTSP